MARRLRLLSVAARLGFLVALLVSLYLGSLSHPTTAQVVSRYATGVLAIVAAIIWGITSRRANRLG